MGIIESYDFTGAMPADQTKIAFFNDLSQQGDGTDAWTIYIDNLAQSTGGDTGGTDPVAATIALPVDFEEAADAYEIAGFDGGVASVEAGPDGAVSLKYVKGAGQNWAGVWINLDTAVDAANGEIVTADVHSTVARDITLKFDAAGVERVASHTGSGWESLSYDFTGAMPADQTKIAFFNDLSQQGDGSADWTIHIDNLAQASGGDTGGGDTGGTDPDPVASTTYCATPVKHFLIDAEVASEVALTVERVDANTVDVSVVSTDADPVDLVLVGAQSGDAAGVSAMDLENGTATVTLTWANGAPDTTSFEVLWSKESNGGNWMLRQEDLPSINTAATCETGGDTGGTDPEPTPTLTLTVTADATTVGITGPWWEWGTGGPAATDNGDGTWTVVFDPAPADTMEYKWLLDGVQEDLVTPAAAGEVYS